MKIQSLHINNYKSLVNVEIINPQPFSVFVGANASGKSNIFEAIEFLTNSERSSSNETLRRFGGNESIFSKKNYPSPNFSLHIAINFGNNYDPMVHISYQGEDLPGPWHSISLLSKQLQEDNESASSISKADYKQFINCHSRIFVNSKETISYTDDLRLSSACGNLPKVLKRIFKDAIKKEEIVEWLQLLVPSFENIEIKSEELSGTDNLLIYEKGTDKPFPAHLISDGTFNIIALLTAVYQSDEPQFLCIEEPENGLNPKVVKELVGFFRQQCEEKGHYIWLNTHSQTLVRELTNKEIIIVDKINGETKIKQIQDMNLHGVPMDEALLSNMIGGGIPW